jgi:hypothetical protein
MAAVVRPNVPAKGHPIEKKHPIKYEGKKKKEKIGEDEKGQEVIRFDSEKRKLLEKRE